MKEKLEARIKELQGELQTGQKAIEEMDAKRTDLMYTLLRISGAIQALEELARKEEEAAKS